MNIYISETNASDNSVRIIKEVIAQIGATISTNQSMADILISYSDKNNLLITSDSNVIEISSLVKAGAIADDIIKLHNYNGDINFTFSDIIFNPNKSTIELKNKEIVKLTDKEKEIIMALYYCKNNLMNKEELLKKIWGYASIINTHTLETHIYRLRQKLKDNQESPSIIKNIDGCYKLIL